MSKIVQVTATYNGNADQIFGSALRFSEMAEAMAGLASYAGLPANDTAIEGETIVVDVTILGLFKQLGHRIHIERIDPDKRMIQSRESGNGIRKWDHTLSVQPDGETVCWTDTIVVDAGMRTTVMAYFAAMMYKRRHRRRKALAVSSRIVPAA